MSLMVLLAILKSLIVKTALFAIEPSASTLVTSPLKSDLLIAPLFNKINADLSDICAGTVLS